MFRFALKTLIADRGKALTALVGVVFSLVLVNIQGGLYFGMISKASLLTDHCSADIWVGHRKVENVDLADNIPEVWINRLRGLPGVQRAEPYVVGKGVATLPDGGFEDVWIIGSEADSLLGTAWTFAEGTAADLRQPNAVSIDIVDARKLGYPEVGDSLEINGQQARVVAMTNGILGFMTTPYLFTTLEHAKQLSRTPAEYCSYFLVQAEPQADLQYLKGQIQERVPELDVYTAQEFGQTSQDYWMKRTGIGISFGTATFLGIVVGLLMVAQSLYALALDNLTEYATLKAIGAEDYQVASVVMTQSLSVAAVGSVIGFALVFFMQRTMSTPVAPIEIPVGVSYGSVALVSVICLVSTIVPFLRIRRVDPAVVLQG